MTRALPLLLALAACGPAAPEDAAPVPRADRAVPAQADSLLARVDGRAFAGAFAALERLGYEADVRVETQTGEDGLGHAAYRVLQTPRGREVVRASASGGLADSSDTARLRPRDPLRAVLADVPAYADPATRDRYRTQIAPDGVAEAALIAESRGAVLPVESARARVEPATGRVLAAHVRRASESLILDEATEARVALGRTPGGALVPAAFSTTSRVRTAGGEARTIRVSWRVRAVGGEPVEALPGTDLPARSRFAPDAAPGAAPAPSLEAAPAAPARP